MEKTKIFAVSCISKKNISSYEKSDFSRFIVHLRKNNNIIDVCRYSEEDYGIDSGYRYTPFILGKE